MARYCNHFVCVFVFLFVYLFNYLTPLQFGDDMVYQFAWQPGQRLLQPLPADITRISSWGDIFYSVWNHYWSWHGRITGAFFMFFAGWIGKGWFNVLNAIMAVVLFLFIHKFSDMRNNLSSTLWKSVLFGMVFMWVIMPGWEQVFLWKCGSVSYLWTTVLVFSFLFPYVKALYGQPVKTSLGFIIGMFLLGLFSGCTNESFIPFVIIGCGLLAMQAYRDKNRDASWMYFGLFGLVVGYLIMILSPGVSFRVLDEVMNMSEPKPKWAPVLIERVRSGILFPWLFWPIIKDNVVGVFFMYGFPAFPFLYLFYIWVKDKKNTMCVADKRLLYWLVFSSVFSALLGVICPYLVQRFFFFPYLFLVIALLILVKNADAGSVYYRVFRFTLVASCIFFVITSGIFLQAKMTEWQKYLVFHEYLLTRKGQVAAYVLDEEPGGFANKMTRFWGGGKRQPCRNGFSELKGWEIDSVQINYELKGLHLFVRCNESS